MDAKALVLTSAPSTWIPHQCSISRDNNLPSSSLHAFTSRRHLRIADGRKMLHAASLLLTWSGRGCFLFPKIRTPYLVHHIRFLMPNLLFKLVVFQTMHGSGMIFISLSPWLYSMQWLSSHLLNSIWKYPVCGAKNCRLGLNSERPFKGGVENSYLDFSSNEFHFCVFISLSFSPSFHLMKRNKLPDCLVSKMWGEMIFVLPNVTSWDSLEDQRRQITRRKYYFAPLFFRAPIPDAPLGRPPTSANTT